MNNKIKIQYGIFAGEGNGIRLRKALRAAGYEVVKTADQADIIIAHSAGCFWLPEAHSHQKLMLIDPPYWPSKTIRERARSRSRNNLRYRRFGYSFRYWMARNLWGAYYAIRDYRRTMRIVRHAPAYDLSAIVHNRTVLLVRNEHDDWLTPDLDELEASNPKLKVAHIPGDHDHITHHPEVYVRLLQSL